MFCNLEESEKRRYINTLLNKKFLSTRQVYTQLGISRSKLFCLMKEFGIKSSKSTISTTITKRLLQDLVERGYTRKNLEKFFKCKHTLIDRMLRTHAIQPVRGNRFTLTEKQKQFLICNHHRKRIPLSNIAVEFNTSCSVLKSYMQREGIKIYPFSPHAELKSHGREFYIELHYVKKLSVPEIAKKLEAKEHAVRTVMLKFGIEIINHRNRNIPELQNRSWLEENHIQKRKSCQAIAEELGCSVSVVNRRLLELGITPTSPRNIIDEKLNYDWLYKEHVSKSRTTYDIAEEVGCSSSHIRRVLRKVGIGCMGYREETSKQEKALAGCFVDNGVMVEENTRKIITPSEIDIFLPNFNLAVEFNGVYWHSLENKCLEYHNTKHALCREKSISLIHLWDFEMDTIFDWSEENFFKYVMGVEDKVQVTDFIAHQAVFTDGHRTVELVLTDNCLQYQKTVIPWKPMINAIYRLCRENDLFLKIDPSDLPIIELEQKYPYEIIEIESIVPKKVFYNNREYVFSTCNNIIIRFT